MYNLNDCAFPSFARFMFSGQESIVDNIAPFISIGNNNCFIRNFSPERMCLCEDFNVKARMRPIMIRVKPPILAFVSWGNIAKMQPTKIIDENIIMSLIERVLMKLVFIYYLVFEVKHKLLRVVA